ncbi:MAG TPA: hypothetical protein VJU60_10395, partial [Thermoleophilaceae bacterium]|nr:hypothetical protein [Thermoleophilaceae bacterium]
MSIRSALALPCVVLLSLLTATAAHASATLTNPANGATVTYDKDGVPSFAWTLPAGEVDPQLYVAPQASVPDPAAYDPNHVAPFEQECGAPHPGGNLVAAYSCRSDEPLAAGTYYAYITTRVPIDELDYDAVFSPITTFVMPTFLVWGDPISHEFPAIETRRDRAVGSRRVFIDSAIEVRGWFNNPDGKVKFTVTVRHGHKLVKRFRRTVNLIDVVTGGGFA